MHRSLFSCATALLLLATPSLAQKTYATSSNGTLYELDFDAVTWTPLWSTGQTFLFGIAPTNDLNELYMTRFTSGLFHTTLDTQTLVFQGATSPNMATIVYNTNNGQYYGTNHTGLYSYDPVNVSASLIGSYGLFGMYGLTYHSGLDKFLVANTFDGSLYSVDPATGAPTVIGVHGTVQVVGLWYDEISGRTFGVTDTNSQGQMLEFNVTTGQATVLATTGVNFVGIGGVIPPVELVAYCFGDGSATLCPCGNFGTPGKGCANSSGDGAVLSGGGTTSIGQNDLTGHGTNLIPSQAALLFVGNNAVKRYGQELWMAI